MSAAGGTRWRNDAAEMAVIGLCVREPLAFGAARDLVGAQDFFDPSRGLAWEAAEAVWARRRVLTEPLLLAEIELREQARICDVPAAFARWEREALRFRDLRDAASVVSHNAAARRVVEAARRVLDRAEAGAPDPAALASYAVAQIADAASAHGDLAPVPLATALDGFYADLLERRRTPGVSRYPTTGLAPLDNLLVALEPGVYVLAARPGQGKSTLASGIATHVASRSPGTVLYISLEMAQLQEVRRMVAARTGINVRAFRVGDLTDAQMEQTETAIVDLSPLRLRLLTGVSATTPQLRACIRREALRGPVSLVVIDHVGAVAPTPGRYDQSRVQHIGEVSWGMKTTSVELGIPILAISHLNRLNEQQQRPPRMSDLRDSGCLENDAEGVIFLHREDDAVQCIVAKNRNDETGEFPLAFDRAHARFRAPDEGVAPVVPINAAVAAQRAAGDGPLPDEEF